MLHTEPSNREVFPELLKQRRRKGRGWGGGGGGRMEGGCCRKEKKRSRVNEHSTPVFGLCRSLSIHSIFNDSAGHTGFHVGIIRTAALRAPRINITQLLQDRRAHSRTQRKKEGGKALMMGIA